MAKISKNIQVAIADDHSLLRSALAKLINTFEGYNVVMEADNGKDLCEKIMKNVLPDIVLLDINMPVMDGKTCLEELKKNKRLKDIPVVIYSTTRNIQEINQLYDLGASRFIHKPATFNELCATLGIFVKLAHN